MKWKENKPNSMPKNNGYYLLYYPDCCSNKYHIASYEKGKNRWQPIGAEYVNESSHWRELPEEPK